MQVLERSIAAENRARGQVGPSRVQTIDDLRKVHTPGVASVRRLIKEDPRKADEYTVTIPTPWPLITNGQPALGLGV